MKKTKAQLEKEGTAIRKQLLAIEEKEREEKYYPLLRSFAGKCFAYRGNTYGGSKIDERWDVFKRVLDVVDGKDGGLYFVVEQFQTDYHGHVIFEIDYDCPYPDGRNPFEHYEKIDLAEYQNERVKMQEEVAAQKKLRKNL